MTLNTNWYKSGSSLLQKLYWIPLLAVRLSVGYMFFVTGKGKLGNPDQVAEYFTGLGIPFPEFNALLVGSTEMVGGLFLMLGFLTRLTCIPLAVTMVVAISTALMPEVKGLADFVGLSELAYLLIFVWLLFTGAGKASLDSLLARVINAKIR